MFERVKVPTDALLQCTSRNARDFFTWISENIHWVGQQNSRPTRQETVDSGDLCFGQEFSDALVANKGLHHTSKRSP